jgi:hypothetical protein
MTYSSPVLSRRALLRGISVGGALTATAIVLGCGTGENAPGAGLSGSSATGKLVMIIRHGEKPDESSPLRGIDAHGSPDNGSLTLAGWRRAHGLADLLAPPQGPIRAGLARPTVIYAPRAHSDEGTRSRETVGPLAGRLGITVNTSFDEGDEAALAKQVISGPGPALICWQHGGIPAIVGAFSSVSPTPPGQWPDHRFDMVWTLTRTTENWSFAQIPEMALPGDEATPFN